MKQKLAICPYAKICTGDPECIHRVYHDITPQCDNDCDVISDTHVRCEVVEVEITRV